MSFLGKTFFINVFLLDFKLKKSRFFHNCEIKTKQRKKAQN